MGSVERTPMLSPEGSREVEEEMRRPPADTPERRRTFERMRQIAEWKKRRAASHSTKDDRDSPRALEDDHGG